MHAVVEWLARAVNNGWVPWCQMSGQPSCYCMSCRSTAAKKRHKGEQSEFCSIHWIRRRNTAICQQTLPTAAPDSGLMPAAVARFGICKCRAVLWACLHSQNNIYSLVGLSPVNQHASPSLNQLLQRWLASLSAVCAPHRLSMGCAIRPAALRICV